MKKDYTHHSGPRPGWRAGTEAQRKATEESKFFSVLPLCLCASVVDFSVEA
jgi:hypothetical protein